MSKQELLTDEEITQASLLTSKEVKVIAEDAVRFATDNPDVPDAYHLRMIELSHKLSYKKIAEAQIDKVEEVKGWEETVLSDRQILELHKSITPPEIYAECVDNAESLAIYTAEHHVTAQAQAKASYVAGSHQARGTNQTHRETGATVTGGSKVW